MKKFLYVVITFVIALVIWVGITFYKAYQPKPNILQGQIDAEVYNISSKVAGRIDKIFIKKGSIVAKGDLIFSLSSPEVDVKLEQAKAAKDAVDAQKNQVDNGARKEQVKAAYNQWQKAKVAKELMKKTYKRIQKLYEKGVISLQKRDEIYTKYKASEYTANAAKQLAIMTKKGARIEIKKAASAKERVYAAKVDEVSIYMKEKNQYSFHKGEVSDILIHTGELSPVGFPVVSIIDIEDSWAKFAVRENSLSKFKKGKSFLLKIPALGNNSYEFKVTYISVMGDYATWRATQSSKGFDMKSFEVQLRATKHIDGLRIGMSVLLELPQI